LPAEAEHVGGSGAIIAASMQIFSGIIEGICRYYFDLLSGLR
jgi:hypothetical protein